MMEFRNVVKRARELFRKEVGQVCLRWHPLDLELAFIDSIVDKKPLDREMSTALCHPCLEHHERRRVVAIHHGWRQVSYIEDLAKQPSMPRILLGDDRHGVAFGLCR